MDDLPAKEGTIPFDIPSIDKPCVTYYKIIGDLSSGAPPVVVLHGGPGAGHEYLLPFADLWPRYGLPVVFYDQIGCGASTHLPHTAGDKSFWQESLFIAELDNLLDTLKLRDGPGFHILGQSWGGMLGAAFAASRPRGLRRLVLASALASKELSMKGIDLLRRELLKETQRALDEAERTGEYEGAAYQEAVGFFYKKHLCHAEPFPPQELLPTLKHLNEDKTVYGTMCVCFLLLFSLRLDLYAGPRVVWSEAGERELSALLDRCASQFLLSFPPFGLLICSLIASIPLSSSTMLSSRVLYNKPQAFRCLS